MTLGLLWLKCQSIIRDVDFAPTMKRHSNTTETQYESFIYDVSLADRISMAWQERRNSNDVMFTTNLEL